MERPCEVWALGKTRRRRLIDWFTRGHARHVCVLNRPRMLAEHDDSDHECGCRMQYAKQATDND